ncbi:membrane protein, partial [Lactobacillus delbrueckii subsp. bulgaricus]
PLLHVAFYLFLAGLAGGLAATISLAVTCFISNYFTDIAMAFLLSLIFNAFSAATTSAFFFSPNLFLHTSCPLYIPSLAVALSELLLEALLFS